MARLLMIIGSIIYVVISEAMANAVADGVDLMGYTPCDVSILSVHQQEK